MCMLYIRVIKSCQHGFCKLFEFPLRKRQGRNDFIEDRRFDKVQNQLIVHGLQHDIVSAQIRSQYE